MAEHCRRIFSSLASTVVVYCTSKTRARHWKQRVGVELARCIEQSPSSRTTVTLD